MGTIKIYFKWNHKQYYQQYCQGNLLLWARNTETGKDHFLGIFKDNTVTLSNEIYNKDWDIKHGAQKLAKIILKKYHDPKQLIVNELQALPSTFYVVGRHN